MQVAEDAAPAKTPPPKQDNSTKTAAKNTSTAAKADDSKKEDKTDDNTTDAGKATKANEDEKDEEDKPHHYRKNSWTPKQDDATHQTEFDKETQKPSGYLDHIKAQIESDIQDAPKKVRGNPDKNGNPTISYVVPYGELKSAWTDDHHDVSNEKEFDAETLKPSGYQASLGALAENKA